MNDTMCHTEHKNHEFYLPIYEGRFLGARIELLHCMRALSESIFFSLSQQLTVKVIKSDLGALSLLNTQRRQRHTVPN